MLSVLLLAAVLAQPQANVAQRASQAATQLYAALNDERRRNGLPQLELDSELSDAAVEHVEDMAQYRYFEHTSPAGVTPWDRMRRHGCFFSYAGENIALAGSGPEAARALYKSPPHRANILSPRFTRVGIGVSVSADGRLLFVEDFSD
jgi:uncharacterized protein YkwD